MTPAEWTVDLAAKTATHTDGWVVRFAGRDGELVEFAKGYDFSEVPAVLSAAGDAYAAAKRNAR